jgi:hypothetical protein
VFFGGWIGSDRAKVKRLNRAKVEEKGKNLFHHHRVVFTGTFSKRELASSTAAN